MPGETAPRRPAQDKVIGQKRMEIVNRIDLRMRGIGPGQAQGGKPAFHDTQHMECLLPQAIAAGITVSDNMVAIAAKPFRRLATACDHE